MRILLTLCVCCVFGIFGIHDAHADALVADLSEHLVKIDLGFTGKKVLLYGAIEGDGKVVVVVQGPREPITIRRKARIAGVWANEASVTFKDAISFYQVMASEELDEWLPFFPRTTSDRCRISQLQTDGRDRTGAASGLPDGFDPQQASAWALRRARRTG